MRRTTAASASSISSRAPRAVEHRRELLHEHSDVVAGCDHIGGDRGQ